MGYGAYPVTVTLPLLFCGEWKIKKMVNFSFAAKNQRVLKRTPPDGTQVSDNSQPRN